MHWAGRNSLILTVPGAICTASVLVRCLSKCICLSQAIRDARERRLAVLSFTSDVQLFQELDAIAGSSGNENYNRSTIMQFLRSKEWIIEEMENVAEEQPSQQPAATLVRPKPNMHIVFESSASESGDPQPCSSTAPAPTKRQTRMLIYRTSVVVLTELNITVKTQAQYYLPLGAKSGGNTQERWSLTHCRVIEESMYSRNYKIYI